MRHDLRLPPHACCLSSELTCCQDGNVAVYNLQKESRAPVYLSTPVNGKHLDTVWQVGSEIYIIHVTKFSKIVNTSWRYTPASLRAIADTGRETDTTCTWRVTAATERSQLLLEGPQLLLDGPRLSLEEPRLFLEEPRCFWKSRCCYWTGCGCSWKGPNSY